MKTWKSYREHSRIDFGETTEGNLCRDQIQFGAILRIADATEKMAENHAALIAQRDRYEKWYEEEKITTQHLQKTIAGLRGYIKKLKK